MGSMHFFTRATALVALCGFIQVGCSSDNKPAPQAAKPPAADADKAAPSQEELCLQGAGEAVTQGEDKINIESASFSMTKEDEGDGPENNVMTKSSISIAYSMKDGESQTFETEVNADSEEPEVFVVEKGEVSGVLRSGGESTETIKGISTLTVSFENGIAVATFSNGDLTKKEGAELTDHNKNLNTQMVFCRDSESSDFYGVTAGGQALKSAAQLEAEKKAAEEQAAAQEEQTPAEDQAQEEPAEQAAQEKSAAQQADQPQDVPEA